MTEQKKAKRSKRKKPCILFLAAAILSDYELLLRRNVEDSSKVAHWTSVPFVKI